MGQLMYGAGLRLMECCRLRVKDVDRQRGQLTVRGGKGAKDRYGMLPSATHAELAKQLIWRRCRSYGTTGPSRCAIRTEIAPRCALVKAQSSLISRDRLPVAMFRSGTPGFGRGRWRCA
jgi:integrase